MHPAWAAHGARMGRAWNGLAARVLSALRRTGAEPDTRCRAGSEPRTTQTRACRQHGLTGCIPRASMDAYGGLARVECSRQGDCKVERTPYPTRKAFAPLIFRLRHPVGRFARLCRTAEGERYGRPVQPSWRRSAEFDPAPVDKQTGAHGGFREGRVRAWACCVAARQRSCGSAQVRAGHRDASPALQPSSVTTLSLTRITPPRRMRPCTPARQSGTNAARSPAC